MVYVCLANTALIPDNDIVYENCNIWNIINTIYYIVLRLKGYKSLDMPKSALFPGKKINELSTILLQFNPHLRGNRNQGTYRPEYDIWSYIIYMGH